MAHGVATRMGPRTRAPGSPRTPDAGDPVQCAIAYDAAGDRLFVTGKLWPRVFEIKLVKK